MKLFSLHRSVLGLPLLATALASASAFAAPDFKDALAKADRIRGGVAQVQIETEVTLLDAAGKEDKKRLYTVFVRDALHSLVVMRSPAEAGQKVLMAGEDFWLLMPSSQRPLRITPAQKLLGDASTGDIASLSWSESYDGTVVGEESCGEPAPDRRCWKLALNAYRKGVSYSRIDLWVGAKAFEPVRADYYVQSDKVAKRAVFIVDDAAAPKEVEAIRLRDELAAGRETVVKYLSRKPRTVPETWFNPTYLVRNPALD